MSEVKKISEVDYISIKECWGREVDFSRWITENLDTLNHALGMNLVSAETEESTGNFFVDILAEDKKMGTIVIENQYGSSDHDHLGKLLTYLNSFDADGAIWIVPEVRDEHVKVIRYLNDETSQKYFLVKVAIIKVENSPMAPVFTLLAGPNNELKKKSETKQQIKKSSKIIYRFWEQFLNYIQSEKINEGLLHQNCSPTENRWIVGGSGISGVTFNYFIKKNSARAELFISKKEKSENKEIFDIIHNNKKTIENKIDAKLNWNRLDSKIASVICVDETSYGYLDEDEWEKLNKDLSHNMRQLVATIKPEIEKIKMTSHLKKK